MGPVILLAMLCIMPLFVIFYIRKKVRGKMLCYFIRKDRSLVGSLCELKNDFVYWNNRAYDVYPDLVRLQRYPAGPMIPSFMQEIVPCSLYMEEYADPMDWVDLNKSGPRSMELEAALEENFFRKMIHETSAEAGGKGFNFRKMLPIIVIVVALVGLIILLTSKGCLAPAAGG